MGDTKYAQSERTYPIVSRAGYVDVDDELQDIVNDFTYRVYGSADGVLSMVNGSNSSQIPMAKAKFTTFVNEVLEEIKTISAYEDVADRLSLESSDFPYSGSSTVETHVRLSVDGDSDDTILITNTFNTQL